MKQPEVIYFFEGKSKNRRVYFYALKYKYGNIFFRVVTKRLVDFSERKIISTDMLYSYETLRSVNEMFYECLKNDNFKKITQKYTDKMSADIMHVKTNINVK